MHTCVHMHTNTHTPSLSLPQWHENCFTARLLSLIKQLLTIQMEAFMSLADFSTVKANSTASGELCLAPQLMGTEEDTGEEEVECRGVISRQSIYMSVVSPLMCWLRVGPPKRVKIESWASVSADKSSSEIDLIRWRFFFVFFPQGTPGAAWYKDALLPLAITRKA